MLFAYVCVHVRVLKSACVFNVLVHVSMWCVCVCTRLYVAHTKRASHIHEIKVCIHTQTHMHDSYSEVLVATLTSRAVPDMNIYAHFTYMHTNARLLL